MKILAIGDPHGKLPKKIDRIIKKNKIDVIVCVGDIPMIPKDPHIQQNWRGFRVRANRSFRELARKLCSYEVPFLTLRGNMYRSERGDRITKKIFTKYKNLYYKETGKIKVKGKTFLFFDMSFEPHMVRREHDKKFFKSVPLREAKLNRFLRENKNAVLISHAPPYNCLDKIPSGKHIGSKVLLRAIKKYQPKLVLCGHIHEAKGEAKIGKTKVINLGCCGDYKLIEV